MLHYDTVFIVWIQLCCKIMIMITSFIKLGKPKLSPTEPAHEMVLFVLRKLILQMRIRSRPVGLDV